LNNFAKRTFAVLTRLSSHPLILGLLTACSLFYRFLVIEFVWSNWFPFACVHVSKSSKRVIGKLEPWDILYRSTCKPKKKLDSDFLKGNFDNGTPEKVCWNVHFLEMFRQDEKHIMLKNHILCFSILSTKSKSEIRCNKRVGG